MKAKEKAGELVNLMCNASHEDYCTDVFETAKRCTLIAVKYLKDNTQILSDEWNEDSTEYSERFGPDYREYWEEVEQEINNL